LCFQHNFANPHSVRRNRKKDLKKYQDKLKLTAKQFQKWAGKRYIVLIEIKNIKKIQYFPFNRDIFKNMMDDWLPVENIETVKK